MPRLRHIGYGVDMEACVEPDGRVTTDPADATHRVLVTNRSRTKLWATVVGSCADPLCFDTGDHEWRAEVTYLPPQLRIRGGATRSFHHGVHALAEAMAGPGEHEVGTEVRVCRVDLNRVAGPADPIGGPDLTVLCTV